MCPELQPQMITDDTSYAISIKNNATFHWGLKDPSQDESDDDDKKDEKKQDLSLIHI